MKTSNSIFSFKFSPELLREQVDKYDILKMTESARGQVVLFFGVSQILAIFLLNLLIAYPEGSSVINSVILEFIFVICPLLYFINKGKLWAMYGLAGLWTIEKLFSIVDSVKSGGFASLSLIFLWIGLALCIKAIQVEKSRTHTSITDPSV
jgi:FtsH-binding integral membrane protein